MDRRGVEGRSLRGQQAQAVQHYVGPREGLGFHHPLEGSHCRGWAGESGSDVCYKKMAVAAKKE